MRFVVQKVAAAGVDIDGKTVGKIGKGFLVLAGISGTDNEQTADKMIKKLIGLRLFEDESGKTNLNLEAVGGEILFISQFTLYADCSHGNRPSFINAGHPSMAKPLYEYMLRKIEESVGKVEHGEFGADMKVSLINDGPFTVVLDSDELFK
ncbi:MAG: D-aminoacyl-tRNA deacylase [Clostridiales bacterium]|nr:D-aminoacyl-tRNA deacylase [Clostridiales bacterium]